MSLLKRKRIIGPPGVGPTYGEPPSTETKESLLKTVLIPLGSLLVAALGLIVRDVPAWVTVVIVTYIAVVAVAVLIAPVHEFWKWIRKKALAYALARNYYPQLQQLVNILSSQIDQSRSETVYYVWHSISGWEEARERVKPDHAHFRTLYSWLFSIGKRLESNKRSEFTEIASELGELVIQYSRFCEQAHRELDSLATTGVLQPQKLRLLKQEWNQIRDKHNQTVKTWEDLTKNINKAAGERICIDHYSPLKTIE